MAGNFDYLHDTEKMQEIIPAAEEAEKSFEIGYGACCLLSRRAADYALRWMLLNDSDLRAEYAFEKGEDPDEITDKLEQYTMQEMLRSFAFGKRIRGKSGDHLYYIRTRGNKSAHDYTKKLKKEEAVKSLEGLHFFLGFLRSRYDEENAKLNPSPRFDKSLLVRRQPVQESKPADAPKQSTRKNESLEFYQYETFADACGHLTKTEQKTVEKTIQFMFKARKLNSEPAPVPGAEDENIFMLPADNHYKLYNVVYWQDRLCAFLYVAEKEKAIQWAKTVKCEVNFDTNELQVFTAARPGSKAITPESDRVQENIEEKFKNPDQLIFRDYDADTLVNLGVPVEYISELYGITAEIWPSMRDRLPKQAFDCLSLVLNGMPAEQVIKETYGHNKEVSPDDILTAAGNPQAGLVKINSEEEVIKMLEEPLEKWRVFLHPQQRSLAYRHYEGATRVLGGAGTGKSVVAIHHAKFLASDSPAYYKILFTTFTNGLTEDLDIRLNSICTEQENKKITVLTLDTLIGKLLYRFGQIDGALKGTFKYKFQYDDKKLLDVWDKAILQSGIEIGQAYTSDFFKDEWTNVIQAQDIEEEEAYLNADRQGRGRRIDRETRKKLWTVFESYKNIMSANDRFDKYAAANFCCHRIREMSDQQRRRYDSMYGFMQFDSVIVDESPDFGPAEFRLLRALCGEPHQDDFYITGDPRQQIYTNKPKLVLSKCGINVKGRSSSLILNYRTTGNILRWANRLLQGIEYEDLDGGKEDTQSSVSTVEGEKPTLKRFDTRDQELGYVSNEINALHDKGISFGEIAVIARTDKLLSDCRDALDCACITASIGHADPDSVCLTTMHDSKGLEFSHVFVISLNRDEMPNRTSINGAPDDEERMRRINQERQLLYVAMTRARKNVYLTYSGEPSEFLSSLEAE